METDLLSLLAVKSVTTRKPLCVYCPVVIPAAIEGVCVGSDEMSVPSL